MIGPEKSTTRGMGLIPNKKGDISTPSPSDLSGSLTENRTPRRFYFSPFPLKGFVTENRNGWIGGGTVGAILVYLVPTGS